MKATQKYFLLQVVAILCVVQTSIAQNNGDTLYYLDFLNLKGQFIKQGNFYTDSAGFTYGISDKKQCRWYYAEVVGQQAIVKGSVIAEHDKRHKYISLYYPDKVRYIRFKKGNFTDFIKANTLDGQLVESFSISFEGSKPKVYCNFNRRTYKISNQCD